MAGASKLQDAQSPEWERLESLATRFEAAWGQVTGAGMAAEMDPYLPAPGDPLRPKALHELIAVDLEIRWKRGQGIKLDDYLKKFPELGSTAALPPMLVFEEFRVRSRFGDRPRLDSYQKRFPDQFPHLQKKVHEDPTLNTPTAATLEYQPRSDESAGEPPSTLRTAKPSSPPASPPAKQSAADSQVLSLVGEYRMLRRIGQGAFGQVWMAEAPGGTEVAIKVILRTLEERDAQQEKKALDQVKKLRHPYLLQTHSYHIMQDRLHIVMELADRSLSDRIRECREQNLPGIPVDELLSYFKEAAEGLDYLHEKGVHHRDIKPANILLLAGHAKLADFGLARALGVQTSITDASMCGTPSYMAPEVWRSKVSRHSDQWSLAVAYAELRLNRRLFTGNTLPALMVEILESQYDLAPLPDAEQQVLRKALATNPQERYPTCKDFVQALDNAVHPPPPEPERTVIVEGEGKETGNRLAVWAAGVVVACLVLAGVGLYMFQDLFRPQQHTRDEDLVPPRITLADPPPLLVATGRSATFPVRIERQNFNGKVRITFVQDDIPKGVTIPTQEIGEGEEEASVPVAVALDAPYISRRIRIRTEGEGPSADSILQLSILYLPPNFEPDGDIVTDGKGVKYYQRIVCTVEGIRVPFILIPHKTHEDRKSIEDPETFYIMENKVSLGLFRKFATRFPEKVSSKAWDPGTDDQRPVLGMTVDEAHRFASSEWFHGKLPTAAQWDKAAGRYETSRGEGPYRGIWKAEPKADDPNPSIAVYGLGGKPAAVGSSRDDVSPSGCRDMAGNGYELTRDLLGGKGTVPVNKPKISEHVVKLRGHSFTELEPLRYIHLDDEKNMQFSLPYTETQFDVGFRVVIEP